MGWFGLLTIAVISGLIIKIVGDPLVQVVAPTVEDLADEAEDWLDDQEVEERVSDWLDDRR